MYLLWSNRIWLTWLLWPFSIVFRGSIWLRKRLYQMGLLKKWQSPVPVIVVGNLTVGGNGKTPFVIWLSEQLTKRGYRVGIVARGYGGASDRYPLIVTDSVKAQAAGDEPVLIHKRTGLPVVVAPQRALAVQALLAAYIVDIIISDDGLQHYALARDKEILVVDSDFGFGNNLLLPAGPLREPRARLNSVDLIVINGSRKKIQLPIAVPNTQMRVEAALAINLVNGEQRAPTQLGSVQALAGIGHPEHFFDSLAQLGVGVTQYHTFPDHYAYSASDLEFGVTDQEVVLMTEKDAVKCQPFAKPNWWYLPIDAKVDEAIISTILSGLTIN